ncbi:hypothetical protein LEP1GSC047_0074 [Leptospira inadai serovar Lyme str. 10]|uniref:Lipoprotein n=2 Tax=Leptospira inadai serovar Lyme TaxID=293084 RepID=V6HDL5_9LEPT|nr:lipoprotein [Leptospira inadai]EQA38251.1 hypothetical protein LEP1GSC047_0074 [Leptospira inadai serovar Lyme str. 10]PNV73998.1 lipoprotein [Leptospira inadai serovar Lyme]
MYSKLIYYFFIFPSFSVFLNCSSLFGIYFSATSTIRSTPVDGKSLVAGERILVLRFVSKSANQPSVSSSLFSDNLTLFLEMEGFQTIQSEEGFSSKSTASAVSSLPNSSSLSSLADKETKLTISDSNQRPFRFNPLLSSEEAREFCSSKQADYVLGGFLYESQAGDVLNPVFSSGIIATIYNRNGVLVNRFQVADDRKMEIFSINSETARLLAKKIGKILK